MTNDDRDAFLAKIESIDIEIADALAADDLPQLVALAGKAALVGAVAVLYQEPAPITLCVCCDAPATIALADWDLCQNHFNLLAAPDDTELVCSGSGQSPRIADGKPHCRVCGQRFKWQDLINQVKHIPEHL